MGGVVGFAAAKGVESARLAMERKIVREDRVGGGGGGVNDSGVIEMVSLGSKYHPVECNENEINIVQSKMY